MLLEAAQVSMSAIMSGRIIETEKWPQWTCYTAALQGVIPRTTQVMSLLCDVVMVICCVCLCAMCTPGQESSQDYGIGTPPQWQVQQGNAMRLRNALLGCFTAAQMSVGDADDLCGRLLQDQQQLLQEFRYKRRPNMRINRDESGNITAGTLQLAVHCPTTNCLPRSLHADDVAIPRLSWPNPRPEGKPESFCI